MSSSSEDDGEVVNNLCKNGDSNADAFLARGYHNYQTQQEQNSSEEEIFDVKFEVIEGAANEHHSKIEVTKSNLGKEQLCIDDYKYRRNKCRKGSKYWICVQSASISPCFARVTTTTNRDGALVIKSYGKVAHNHFPNAIKNEAHKAINALKVSFGSYS